MKSLAGIDMPGILLHNICWTLRRQIATRTDYRKWVLQIAGITNWLRQFQTSGDFLWRTFTSGAMLAVVASLREKLLLRSTTLLCRLMCKE